MDNQIQNRKLYARLPLLLLIFCILQPLLDVASYAQMTAGLPNTATMIIRLLLLAACFVLGYLASERKRNYYVSVLILGLYLAGHVAACIRSGSYQNWSEDLADQARTLLLPITALSMISCLRRNPDCFRALCRGMLINLFLILVVEVLSTVTGTDPHTYEAKAIGVRGWFNWTSAQSANLCMLVTVAVAWCAHSLPDRPWATAAVSLAGFGMLYFFGTRLAFFCIALIGAGLTLFLLLQGKKGFRRAAAVFAAMVLFLVLYPISPMVKNRTAMAVNSRIKQERVSAAAAEYGVPEDARTTDNLLAIQAAYHYNLQGMIDRFGLEEVADLYEYTLDAETICNDRLMKTRFCVLLMQKYAARDVTAALFGLELCRTRMVTEVYDFDSDSWVRMEETYDPENDFAGVFFLNGAVGLTLILAMLLAVGLRVLRCLLRSKQKRRSFLLWAFCLAFCIALLYAYATVSVLRRNNASVYLGIILACLWHLSEQEQAVEAQ